MITEEALKKLYQDLKSEKIASNHFSRVIKKDPELSKYLGGNSCELDNFYKTVTSLQRMWFIFEEKEIKFCQCGQPRKWRNFSKGYNKSCGSKECMMQENRASVQKFYQEKFGVDHLFQTEEFQKKIKKKFIQKFGVDNPGKSQEIKDKIKRTNLERFGETSWLKVKENSEKISAKLSEKNRQDREEKIKKFGIPVQIKKFQNGKSVQIFCKQCSQDSEFSPSYFTKKIRVGQNPCLVCFPPLLSESKSEVEFADYISSIYEGKVERKNRKILDGKEIDVFLPDLKIGFEFNGIYYHSEIFKEKSTVVEKKNLSEKMGINLITVWEDEWVYKKQILQSRIASILGKNKKIHARKCKVREIDGSTEKRFLEINHIQGFVPSQIKLGLFLGEEIVSVMTFGKYRVSLGTKEKDNQFELLRFCNVLETGVVGGASKLFNYFVSNYRPERVISYQNNSWNTGNLYENLGFEKVGITKQNYYWCKGNIRFNRFNFRKDKLIREGFDPKKTEDEIMTERGYYKLWDLGNVKWVHKKV